jgi:glutathione S-transferase
MTLTFYTNPMSRGRIAHWMLEEIGAPYETVFLDYATTMKQQPYIDINPMGKVPAIVHDGRIVTECAAICAYLADAFPAVGLAPQDRSAYYRWLFFGAGPLEAAVVSKALGVEVPPERRGMVGFRDLGTTMDVLEDWLTRNSYLAGETFSAADVATGSQIGWGMRFKTLEARPAFVAYWSRISARPALARATAINDAALAAAKEAGHG